MLQNSGVMDVNSSFSNPFKIEAAVVSFCG